MDLTCSYSNVFAPWLLPSRFIKCKTSVDLLLFSWLQSYSCRNLWVLLDLSIPSLHVFFSIILFQQLSNEKQLVAWIFEGIILPSYVGIIISHYSDPYETTTMLWPSLMSGYPVIPIWNNISQLWIQNQEAYASTGFTTPPPPSMMILSGYFGRFVQERRIWCLLRALDFSDLLCFSVVGMLLI